MRRLSFSPKHLATAQGPEKGKLSSQVGFSGSRPQARSADPLRPRPARSRAKIHVHLNLSMATVNVLRWLAVKAGCSPRTYRRVAYNRLIIDRLLSALGLGAEYEVKDPRIEQVAQTGRLAI